MPQHHPTRSYTPEVHGAGNACGSGGYVSRVRGSLFATFFLGGGLLSPESESDSTKNLLGLATLRRSSSSVDAKSEVNWAL